MRPCAIARLVRCRLTRHAPLLLIQYRLVGMVAAAQQGLAAPFGFLNPVLYKLAGTSALRDITPLTGTSPSLLRGESCAAADCGSSGLLIFDVYSSDEKAGFTGQVTRKGYDNMTGLGTPNGRYFIEGLRALEKVR
jgi:hypothetical protein